MHPHQISVPSPAVSIQLDNRAGRVTWWGWRETSGAAAAAFRLWDGSSAAGRLLAPFSLSASESIREWPGMHSLPYVTGLFLEVISGTFEGTVQVISTEGDEAWGMPVIVMGDVTVDITAP